MARRSPLYRKHGKWGVAPYNRAERHADKRAMKKARSESKRTRRTRKG